MTTLNEKYLEKVLPYLHGLDGGECKEKIFRNGLTGYEFPCPFCSDCQSKPKHKRKSTPITSDVIPVLPPAFTPAPDST